MKFILVEGNAGVNLVLGIIFINKTGNEATYVWATTNNLSTGADDGVLDH